MDGGWISTALLPIPRRKIWRAQVRAPGRTDPAGRGWSVSPWYPAGLEREALTDEAGKPVE